MRMNNLGYLIKEGIRGIFSHGLMSFASVCVTVACLIIVGSFSLLIYNLDIMVRELNQTNQVICYVSSEYTDAEAKSVHSRINMIENVYRADYVSREEALANFIADEPTGNLDPARSLELMSLFQEINNLGTTVLVVTHEQELVRRFDKRVIVIDEGMVISDGMDRYLSYENE